MCVTKWNGKLKSKDRIRKKKYLIYKTFYRCFIDIQNIDRTFLKLKSKKSFKKLNNFFFIFSKIFSYFCKVRSQVFYIKHYINLQFAFLPNNV